jgi:hypothetical protein
MDYPEITDENYPEIASRIDSYMAEFQRSGVDKLILEDGRL